MYDYTEWAKELVLAAVAPLSEAELKRDVGASHGSLYGTLLHLLWAEELWLVRWRGHSPSKHWRAGDAPSVVELRARYEQVKADRRAYFADLTDEALNGDLSYRNLAGDSFTYPLGRVLQHVANHSTLHRGQLMNMLRQRGVPPPATDLLFYLAKK